MKKIGELMAEAGFNKNASTSVKEAYIKHLIRAAHGVNVITPSEKSEIEKNPDKIISMNLSSKKSQPEQLAFDFYSDKSEKQTNKKSS